MKRLLIVTGLILTMSGCTVLMRPTTQVGIQHRSQLNKISREKIELVYIHFPVEMTQYTIKAKPSNALSTWKIPVGEALSNTIFDCLSFSFHNTLLLDTPKTSQDSLPRDSNILYITPNLKIANLEFSTYQGIMASRESAFAPMKYLHIKGNIPTYLTIHIDGKSISRDINFEFDKQVEKIPQTTWEIFDKVISEISINYVEYIVDEILN